MLFSLSSLEERGTNANTGTSKSTPAASSGQHAAPLQLSVAFANDDVEIVSEF
jgi:hypothetical protein